MKSSKCRVLLSTKLVYQFVLLIALVASASPVHSDSSAVAPKASITVMSRNLYVGASFNPLVGASTPNDISERVAMVYGTILSSQFPRRAEAIADEIVGKQPDLVGLQEHPFWSSIRRGDPQSPIHLNQRRSSLITYKSCSTHWGVGVPIMPRRQSSTIRMLRPQRNWRHDSPYRAGRHSG